MLARFSQAVPVLDLNLDLNSRSAASSLWKGLRHDGFNKVAISYMLSLQPRTARPCRILIVHSPAAVPYPSILF